MASPPVDQSHGITIEFADSAFTAEIVDVTPPGETRDSLDTTHQGTVNRRTFIPVKVTDSGELVFTVHHNPDTAPPLDNDDENELITITYPSGAVVRFSGHMTGYEPDAPHLELLTAEVTVKVSGIISRTAGSGG